MADFRLISRLDIKGTNVIKGYQMEGFRIVGDPKKLARNYYHQGVDEIIFNDVVASLYKRDQIVELIKFAAKDFFIPLTVIGGIRSVENARELFKSGADKVGINTAALKNPRILKEISESYGTQAVVLSVEAKRNSNGTWTTYGDSGRTDYGKAISDWIIESINYGVGEIIITSVDRDGTKSGFDLELMSVIPQNISVPVIISGGIASQEHLSDVANHPNIDGVAIGCAFHEKIISIPEAKKYAQISGRKVRM